jgi:hypothetical protein
MTGLSTELEAGLARFMEENAIDRDEALRRILAEWLGERHYLPTSPRDGETTEVAETVQYPEFMDDGSGGAGG